MKTDSEFTQALKGSERAVRVVASWFRSLGREVRVPSLKIRPDFKDRLEYVDSGDLFILKEEGEKRVEIKHRNLAFKSAKDYPYSTVFVDEKHKVDRLPLKDLAGYITINKDFSSVCCIQSGSKKHWKTKRKFDKKDDQVCEFYECPVEYCQFFQLKREYSNETR